ncbi:MAG TPA: hypothetical protein PK511_05300 [Chitinophagales bacterium]|nr:hypothetical protein [Chitinophagales bacterium]HMX04725.1 hypothetical protein [Chitinophagales bacterium]HMZ88646.1 hypothetical protein [Chitinophagales bacterium]HNA57035.1 hypothetical protein [Chitinophagales bacterium]HNI53915.1 hypothetical protein [Chitinophagales bacterium]
MPEDEFYEDSVQTMEDFIRYVHELRKDLKTNPEDFENNTLPLFKELISKIPLASFLCLRPLSFVT